MKFIELSESYKDAWNEVALNSDEAWLFHLYVWLPFTTQAWNLESWSFLLEHEGKIIGIFPLQRRKASKDLRSTFMGNGGAALINGLPPGLRSRALKAMYAHARELAYVHQCQAIEISLSPLAPSAFTNERHINPLIHHFYEDTSTHTWMLDLTASGHEILGNYADDARRSIKKAAEKGYTVSLVQDLAGMEAYYAVHEETAKRNGLKAHRKEYIMGVFEHFCLQEKAFVWQAKDAQGEPVAFEITAFFKQAALYWMGCCRTTHLDSGVNYLLQHHAILGAKERGARWFENGEAFPQVQDGKLRGLTVFKGKFGGELHRYYRGRTEIGSMSVSHPSSLWKDWVRSSLRLLKPVLKEEGVVKLESRLIFVYQRVRKAARIKDYFFCVQYLKPFWQGEEFLAVLTFNRADHGRVLEELVAMLRKELSLQGAVFLTSSGRTALELALKVIKIKNPDKRKVIITTYGCRGVFDPVTHAGFEPLFADIDETLNLSDRFVETLLQAHEDVAAIVIPHLCGKIVNVDRLCYVAREKRIVIIEDLCQSLGSPQSPVTARPHTDMTIFSFGLGKNLSASSGGMLVSNIMEPDLVKEYAQMTTEDTAVVRTRFWKIVGRTFLKLDVDISQEIKSGYQYARLHPLDARLIMLQLRKLDKINASQNAHAREIIDSLMKTQLKFHLQEATNHVYSKLSIIFDDERHGRLLSQALDQALVETEDMYTPLHLRDFSKDFLNGHPLIKAESVYKNVFNIPVRPNLTRRQVDRIKKAIEGLNEGKKVSIA